VQAFNLIFQMLPTLMAFSFLLTLFVYIFALAGMQVRVNGFKRTKRSAYSVH
jgi:hypothetical protein